MTGDLANIAPVRSLPDGQIGCSPVQPLARKYICSRLTQITFINAAVSSHWGAYRDRHERGAGCDGREGSADERCWRGRRSRVVL